MHVRRCEVVDRGDHGLTAEASSSIWSCFRFPYTKSTFGSFGVDFTKPAMRKELITQASN